MPEALGEPVKIIAYVDSDHAGEKLTRRSRTGYLIFLNRAPISWFSKKQTSIETSTFGSEFSALKTVTESVQALRYKLRMMGVPIDGPAHVRCDNMSVVNNTSVPASTLKKKNNAIAYHFVRENVAMDVLEVHYQESKGNLADCLTKVQAGPVRQRLVQEILW